MRAGRSRFASMATGYVAYDARIPPEVMLQTAPPFVAGSPQETLQRQSAWT